MTADIDRDALRAETQAGIAHDGPGAWAGIGAADLLALLDALDAAEARIDAVDTELLYAELHGNDEVWTHNIRRALDGTVTTPPR
jgi:hypothetical protein